MPFTLSHAAAVIPLRRRLPLDALVIGSMAPDFEYLVHLEPMGHCGHAFPWGLGLTVPWALLVLAGWRSFLPSLRRCLGLSPPVSGATGFLPGMAAVSVGILGHLAWDHVTHRTSDGIAFLRVPVLAGWPIYRILQHMSSLAGLGLCLGALRHWLWERMQVPAFGSSMRRLLAWVQSGACLAGVLNACRGQTYRDQAGLFATAWLAGTIVLLAAYVRIKAWRPAGSGA